jgi:hypothetical protein
MSSKFDDLHQYIIARLYGNRWFVTRCNGAVAPRCKPTLDHAVSSPNTFATVRNEGRGSSSGRRWGPRRGARRLSVASSSMASKGRAKVCSVSVDPKHKVRRSWKRGQKKSATGGRA